MEQWYSFNASELTNVHGVKQMALAIFGNDWHLYYDLEARLETSEVTLAGGRREYRVHTVLPCRGDIA